MDKAKKNQPIIFKKYMYEFAQEMGLNTNKNKN